MLLAPPRNARSVNGTSRWKPSPWPQVGSHLPFTRSARVTGTLRPLGERIDR